MTSVAPKYAVHLYDTSGVLVAIFDNWETLSFTHTINSLGSYVFSCVDNGDPRLDLFGLDYLVDVRRKVPGCNLDWYSEFIGLHRKPSYTTEDTGRRIFTSEGFDLNHLLTRRIIGYLAGTIYADKSDVAETVIKQYVNENCGLLATMAETRLSEGTIPGFSVEDSLGSGPLWEGSRAFEALLEVVADIGAFSGIDFRVERSGPAQYVFKTYNGQLGLDRTSTLVNTATGLNVYGNAPVVFSAKHGNIQNMLFYQDRTAEANVVYVLGKGDGSTRDTVVRTGNGTTDSPLNVIEISRPGGNQEFQFQLEDLGDEALKEMAFKSSFEFAPLQKPNCLYGKDYAIGDRVTVIYEDIITKNQRITEVSVEIAEGLEVITLVLVDY